MALEQPCFELLMARLEGTEIGYMYGYALLPEIGWWDAMEWSVDLQDDRPGGYTSEEGPADRVVAPSIAPKDQPRSAMSVRTAASVRTGTPVPPLPVYPHGESVL
jgi:hypothetical protein